MQKRRYLHFKNAHVCAFIRTNTPFWYTTPTVSILPVRRKPLSPQSQSITTSPRHRNISSILCSGRGARRWPSARRVVRATCRQRRARCSVMRAPNLTRISPLRAGEVGGFLKVKEQPLGSGGKGVSVKCLPAPARETN